MKEILITSSVMILVLLFLRTLFSNKVSRRMIYCAWALVALRLLIPVQIGELDFSVLTAAQPVTEIVTEMVDKNLNTHKKDDVYSDIVMDYIETDQTVFVPEVQEQIRQELQNGDMNSKDLFDKIQDAHPDQDIFVADVQQQVKQQITKETKPVTLGQIALVIWLLGATCMAVWFVTVNLRFIRGLCLTRQPLPYESPIPVYVSDGLESPCLVGLIRPVVYVTPACAENPEMLRHVMTHELTHYAHMDHIWSIVRCVCLCIYWFNPLVWAAANCCRRDCELACDEGALKRLGEEEHLDYGKTLLDVVSQAKAPSKLMHAATSMNESKKQLKERVNFIVRRPRISILAAITMALICVIVACCVAAGPSGAKVETLPYISLQSVNNKLGIVCEDSLLLTDFEFSQSMKLTRSLDGKTAVCRPGSLLYIHDGTVEIIAEYADSYSLSVSGNAVAFYVSPENAARANLKSGLYLYHKDSEQPQLVAATVDGTIQDYAISPDGLTMAYLLVAEHNTCQLMLYRDGVSKQHVQFQSNNNYSIISIDNTADVIYVMTNSNSFCTISSINQKGEQTSVGRISYMTPELILNGVFRSNADHTQLMFKQYLSERGQPGVRISESYSPRPVVPALSNYHQDKCSVTYNYPDLTEALMSATLNRTVCLGKFYTTGKYGEIATLEADSNGCWLDPTGRYVFYRDLEQNLYVVDLKNDAQSTLLAESVDCYAISYDCEILHYGDRYLYDYKDGLKKYGGLLYTIDALNGTQMKKLETEVLDAMFFSENGQLFFTMKDGDQCTLYTLTDFGRAKRVLEDVKQFTQDECGMLFVQSGDSYYIIRAGEKIQLDIETIA